jgi:acyl-CoA synthetase (AMP-forming)/AMP-acid ligase II
MKIPSLYSPHAQNFGMGSWPARRASLAPDRIAWRFEGTATSYAEVDRRTRRLSNALIAAGIKPGDRLGYIGFNHPALLEMLFAAGRMGAIIVLINARLSAGEVEYIAHDSGISLLAYGREQVEIARTVVEATGIDLSLNVDKVGEGEAFSRDYEEFLQTGTEHSQFAEVNFDAPCLIMYTSGTTGRPKGAILSHANMFFSATNVLLSADIRPDDVSLAMAPLFHIAGLNGVMMPVFLKGGTNVIHRSFNPQVALDELQNGGVTSMFAVPAMLEAMFALPEFTDAQFPELRTLIGGGAPVPDRTLRAWADKGVGIQQGYGFTEAAPSVTLLGPEYALTKQGSAGKPQFFMDVRVLHPEGRDAEIGESGELLARGMNIMLGYWNREQDTADSFVDDWYRSGDIAAVDEDGFHFLKDRSKDMYISGGENVYPTEVENILLNVPGVAEAAVIGIPDEKWGEVGRAFVVVAPDETHTSESILTGLEPNLARYKLPKSVVFVDSLPRTATGKVQKHLLRDK